MYDSVVEIMGGGTRTLAAWFPKTKMDELL